MSKPQSNRSGPSARGPNPHHGKGKYRMDANARRGAQHSQRGKLHPSQGGTFKSPEKRGAKHGMRPITSAATSKLDSEAHFDAPVMAKKPRFNEIILHTDDFFGDCADSATLASSFGDIAELDDRIKENLNANEWTKMSAIQRYAIPRLMQDDDLLASAPTGSGKTLAFVVPAWQMILRNGNEGGPPKGSSPLVLIITPTRELALQIFEVAMALKSGFKDKTFMQLGALIGGVDKKVDLHHIKETPFTFCIGTPGRLLDHVQNTHAFSLNRVKMLIVDEADRIFDDGFKTQLTALLDPKNGLPAKKQTVLFSATLTSEVRRLAQNHLKRNALHLSVEAKTTVSRNIEQAYMFLSLEKRLTFMYWWIQKMQSQQLKAIAFFSSKAAVEFYEELFKSVKYNSPKPGQEAIRVIAIHGDKKQGNRSRAIEEFRHINTGVLFATDVVARGIDLPQVDYILQVDPPEDAKTYQHRIGRTGRGVSPTASGAGNAAATTGTALMLLQPSEAAFLEHLKAENIVMQRVSVEDKLAKLIKVPKQMEKLVQMSHQHLKSAKRAFRGFVSSYNVYHLKDAFNLAELDLMGVAKSFGLPEPIHIDLGFKDKTRKYRKAGAKNLAQKRSARR